MRSPCGSHNENKKISQELNTVSSQRQIESLYPQIYYIIYPEVVRQCDMLDRTYDQSYMMLTRNQLEPIVDAIYEKVDGILKEQSVEESDYEKSQYGRGRGFLRDVIWLVLLQQLFGRRRRRRFPGYGRPPFRPYGPYRPY